MPPAASPSALPGAYGVMDTAFITLVRHVVASEFLPTIHKVISEMMAKVNAKMDDQYLRLLEYWDPELATKARQEHLALPSHTGALEQSSDHGVLTPPPPPPVPKKRILIVGGKEDGFWSYLPDQLQKLNVYCDFADGHKPKSIPTGKKFDAVIVHWATSHPARAVIRNYYPDHAFMERGSTNKMMSIIKERLSIPE